MRLQLESQARESQSHTLIDVSGDHTVSHVPHIKAIKLPPFHEEKDDLDAYLNTVGLKELVKLLMCHRSSGHLSWQDFYKVRH